MDAPQLQSGSKCGGTSDFSIERILSGDPKRPEDAVEAPEWLCCTRYRPPRLPRPPSACRARRAGRHARVPFTGAQAAALEAAYARAPYLAPPALKALAAALQLRDDRIKIWFQNRRARERREKSTNIAPPNGVTLTPTTGTLPWISTNKEVANTGTGTLSWPPSTKEPTTSANTLSWTVKDQHSNTFPSDLPWLQSNKVAFENFRVNLVNYAERVNHTKTEVDEELVDTPLDIESVD